MPTGLLRQTKQTGRTARIAIPQKSGSRTLKVRLPDFFSFFRQALLTFREIGRGRAG
ncbi:conserved domain protein [Prevotella denticola CRIS 18C-A]|uniref:Conserved domain protein n=1 Tax=Prevotella denticola CRIS 18C-A TaxID=944557 RepID=F0H958_9BACT|nr:conserved domain protein [Prevotella denticola CRIS 18C-A]